MPSATSPTTDQTATASPTCSTPSSCCPATTATTNINMKAATDSWRRYLFGKTYALLMGPLDYFAAAHRRKLVKELKGVVVEVGCGDGANFAFYNEEATVYAFDPNAVLYKKALAKATANDNNALGGVQNKRRGRPAIRAKEIKVIHAGIGDDLAALALPPTSADCLVFSLVLCSIPNPQLALDQSLRLLKHGGTVVVFEHIAHKGFLGRLVQSLCNPLHSWLFDDCCLRRETDVMLASHPQLELVGAPRYFSGVPLYLPMVRMTLRKKI